MLAFYFRLLRDIPSVLRGTHEAWAYWVLSVVVPLVLLFKPEWLPVTESPWLIIVPVGLSVLYGVLRVNYVRFCKLQQLVLDARSREDADAATRALRDELGALLNTFNALRADVTTGKQIAAAQGELKSATDRLRACVEGSLDKGEVAMLTPGDNMKPDTFTLAMQHDVPRMLVYVSARHYVGAIQRLLRDVVPPVRIKP
jgi:hypothetical protein